MENWNENKLIRIVFALVILVILMMVAMLYGISQQLNKIYGN